jgi:hypothetical protein
MPFVIHVQHKKRTHAYLSMKEGCLFVLFCTYRIHRTGMLQIMFLVSLESSLEEKGCIGLVSWCLDMLCKSFWILNDFFSENWIKSKLKFLEELEWAFGVLERSWWARYDGIYLVRSGFRMWEILIFLSYFYCWKFK